VMKPCLRCKMLDLRSRERSAGVVGHLGEIISNKVAIPVIA
jgi:hypothetical protein